MSDFNFNRNTYKLLLITILVQVILGVISFNLISNDGLKFTHDSYYYIKASSLIQKGDYNNYLTDTILVNWPPLYPIIIALLTGNIQFLKYFQLFTYLCTIILPVVYCRKYLESRFDLFVFASLQTFSTITIAFQQFVLSESFFTLLTLVSFVLICKIVASHKIEYNIVWLLIIVSWLISLQRMMGVYVILANSLILWKFKNFRLALFYGAISILSISIWLYVTQVHSNNLLVIHNLFTVKMYTSLLVFVNTLGGYFFLNSSIWSCLIGISYFLILVVFSLNKKIINIQIVKLSWIYFIVYSAALIVSSGEPTEYFRFLTPIFPVLYIALFLGLIHNKYNLIPQILMVTLVFVSIIKFVKNIVFWADL